MERPAGHGNQSRYTRERPMRSRAGVVIAVALGLAGGSGRASYAVDQKSLLVLAANVERAPAASVEEGSKPAAALSAGAAKVSAVDRGTSPLSGHEDSRGLSWKDVWLILLGAVVSLY